MDQIPPGLMSGVNKAAQLAVVPMALADATASISKNLADVKEVAARKGVELYVPVIRPRVVDGSENYPTVLAELLCAHPKKAKLTNEQVMAEVSSLIGLSIPLNGNRMSKRFSAAALNRVREVLTKAGYDGAGVQNGTDVKRLIRAGKKRRRNAVRGVALDTEFLADGVLLDGAKFQYRQRRASTGLAWQDLCIRVAGADVPLSSVLRLRGIGISEFYGLDEAALRAAKHNAALLSCMSACELESIRAEWKQLRDRAKHKKLSASESSRVQELGDFLDSPEALKRRANACRGAKVPRRTGVSTIPTSHRVSASEIVRAYWRGHSPVGRRTECVRELAGFFRSLMDDPGGMERTRSLVDAWKP